MATSNGQVDLSAYAGSDVEVSISYASDDIVPGRGVFVDDIVVSTGSGTTSFEDDGDQLDGWTVPGAPADSEPNPNDWIVGTAADTPESLGEIAEASFARQPEIIDFESSDFGRYPFWRPAGSSTTSTSSVSRSRRRPDRSTRRSSSATRSRVTASSSTSSPTSGSATASPSAAWQHIWLNEGFATYAEWLWSEREGFGTPQEIFDFCYDRDPGGRPVLAVVIGDPGPDALFDGAVYDRGAMTLQQLRLTVGDDEFFKILRRWAQSNAGGNVTTDQFIRLAERISGQQLDELFDTWLFTPGRPELPGAAAARSGATTLSAVGGASVTSGLWRHHLEELDGDVDGDRRDPDDGAEDHRPERSKRLPPRPESWRSCRRRRVRWRRGRREDVVGRPLDVAPGLGDHASASASSSPRSARRGELVLRHGERESGASGS